jgi:hypothetical protein
MHELYLNTRQVDEKSGLRVAKLFDMLEKEFGFRPRKTEEQKLCERVQRLGLADDSDDEMPQIVDCDEEYLF